MDRQFNTDCEGPISKNDNAFELAQEFIPGGGEFFAKLSKYDDFLADITRKPDYKAGNTLKLILPFLKAFGATEAGISEFSSGNILIVPKADIALEYIRSVMPAFIISTSYSPYISSLCKMIGFPYENAYSTRLSIDKHKIPEAEIKYLKELHKEIMALPDITIPSSAISKADLDDESILCIERLDKIFWEELPGTVSAKLMDDVNPVGGIEKANAIRESCKITGFDPSGVMYVGDSITDVEAMKFVSHEGGFTLSFNGNRYAVEAAEFVCISPDAMIIAALAILFYYNADIPELAFKWHKEKKPLEKVFSKLCFPEFSTEGTILRIMEDISVSDVKELIIQSESFRKTVRGEHIGRLG